MFERKLFKSGIEPRCAYCENGKMTGDKMSVLCEKKGIMAVDYSCRKFLYDPIKRVPKKMPKLQKYESEDFQL